MSLTNGFYRLAEFWMSVNLKLTSARKAKEFRSYWEACARSLSRAAVPVLLSLCSWYGEAMEC